MSEVDKAWIETYTGLKFHLLNPQPDEICIEDIAHALAMQCRFTGHTKYHYSVAQHSYYASSLVPEQDALWALLHDASEAYMADLNRPLKHFTDVGPAYLKLEEGVMNAICRKFHLPLDMPATVHRADNLLLYAEKAQLMKPLDWDNKWSETEEAANVTITEWTPIVAERQFLGRYANITQKKIITDLSYSGYGWGV